LAVFLYFGSSFSITISATSAAAISLSRGAAADATNGSNKLVNNVVNNMMEWSLDGKLVLRGADCVRARKGIAL
jgi:hypothetical protein